MNGAQSNEGPNGAAPETPAELPPEIEAALTAIAKDVVAESESHPDDVGDLYPPNAYASQSEEVRRTRQAEEMEAVACAYLAKEGCHDPVAKMVVKAIMNALVFQQRVEAEKQGGD